MAGLNVLYKELDFKSGDLLKATDHPASCRRRDDWLEKGEWLAAGKRAGADKMFFVENNPVAVFAKSGSELLDKIKIFNKTWCLARPRLLFLASPGEITVYDLAQKPVDENNPREWDNFKNLAISTVGEVASKLQKFHRENIESGKVFGDEHFGDLKNRADKALIWDLKVVRSELIAAGLSGENVRFAHSLIGRSIFIRYLEDRGVLLKDYFRNVARQKRGWTNILHNSPGRTGFDVSKKSCYYPRVLSDKSFTYALFRALARDFNGDMFTEIDEEEKEVSQDHLNLIQGLLYGDAGAEKKLFFYSYKFDIIPLDLISSIYEEFYHSSTSAHRKKSKARQDGAYYTPSVLAEFVLSRVLTSDVIKKSPRVLDPACGSGIFLVEAFRRIARYEWHKKKTALTFKDLKEILESQIAGIEVNEEAAKIAAFSLYLSMLHYLDPSAINHQIEMGNRLPHLLAREGHSKRYLHCILGGINAFDTDKIGSNAIWEKRFGSDCADIVIGNPPWGAPGKKSDAEVKRRHAIMVNWCKMADLPIGDEEPSQAFLWRALDFLKPGGKAGMLVSAGILFKHSSTTQEFRNRWTSKVKLNEIFNFVHVRKYFFRGADSPFISVFFSHENQNSFPVYHWAIKETVALKGMRSILMSKNDLNIVHKADLTQNRTWKSLWWGTLNDLSFLNFLDKYPKLKDYIDKNASARGFQEGNKKNPSDWLTKYKELPTNKIERYSPSKPEWLVPAPQRVENRGKTESLYHGSRILVRRGIEQKHEPKGRIIANLYKSDFCFRNSAHCIKLSNRQEKSYKMLLGVLWSSLARYYYFMTSSNWGLWHYEIHLSELLDLPINLDKESPKLISIVDRLLKYNPIVFRDDDDIFAEIPKGATTEKVVQETRKNLEADLDEAVFEFYDLSEEQKDLIRDCCNVTIPFFYKPFDSTGSSSAVDETCEWIKEYINIFSRRWNTYLDISSEMRAEIHVGLEKNIIAIEFYPADKEDPWNLTPKVSTWGRLLEKLGQSLLQPMGMSKILLDGAVQAVSESGIVVIKRSEKRFWTRSLAREDADATLCIRMTNKGGYSNG